MADSHTSHDSPTGSPQKLMERVRHAIRLRHYSHRTEEAYVYWIRRYIVVHRKQHPSAMGAPEVSAFLEWLAVQDSAAMPVDTWRRSRAIISRRVSKTGLPALIAC